MQCRRYEEFLQDCPDARKQQPWLSHQRFVKSTTTTYITTTKTQMANVTPLWCRAPNAKTTARCKNIYDEHLLALVNDKKIFRKAAVDALSNCCKELVNPRNSADLLRRIRAGSAEPVSRSVQRSR